jgi:GxxExxY protein
MLFVQRKDGMAQGCFVEESLLPFLKRIVAMNEDEYEYFAKQIFIAALEVHKNLGPGLLESAYQAAFEMELSLRNIVFETQVRLPLIYKGAATQKEFVIDFLVEREIIVEFKSVEILLPVHAAQILSYLRLSDKRLGFLVNFNVVLLKDGFKRIVNNYYF